MTGGSGTGRIAVVADEVFTEPEPNVIESSCGFSVRVLGRTGLRYTEGEHSVWIDSEVLAAPHGLVMYPPSVRVWEGPGPREVSDAERERVVSNLKRAFASCSYELDVAEPFDWDSVALRRPRNEE